MFLVRPILMGPTVQILQGLLGKEWPRAIAVRRCDLFEKDSVALSSSQTSTAYSYLLTRSLFNQNSAKCQAEERAAKVLERVVPSVTGRSFVTTSRVLPSQPSDGWLAVVVSSVFPALFTKKLVESSRYFIPFQMLNQRLKYQLMPTTSAHTLYM